MIAWRAAVAAALGATFEEAESVRKYLAGSPGTQICMDDGAALQAQFVSRKANV